MPELPEVETIVRYLRPKIRGKRILGVWSDAPRLFRGHSGILKIKKEIRGRKIEDAARIGKNIVLKVSGGQDLLVHLMMTGKLLLFPWVPKEKHIHFWLRFGPEEFLALHDTRKFGRIRLVPRQFLILGKDALSLSFADLKNLLAKRKGNIKTLLLNQKIISGIGNIYSDEILWYAGIKPTRRVETLKKKDIKKLYSATNGVLKKALKAGGTSSRDYRKPDGSEGGYYKIRKAYQRTGRRCSRDGAIIKRIVIGQRSAHYCPKHQK